MSLRDVEELVTVTPKQRAWLRRLAWRSAFDQRGVERTLAFRERVWGVFQRALAREQSAA
jgi:hypothetical protein